MTKRRWLASALLALFLCLPGALAGGERLDALLKQAGQDDVLSCWIFFADKGTVPLGKLADPTALVSERSVQRRLKVLPPGRVVDETDLPLEESYVSQVASLVTKVRQRSKWLNAVSVEATPTQLANVTGLPFVRHVEPVAMFWRKREIDGPTPMPAPSPAKGTGTESLDYGPSFGQLNQINVPAVHNMGNYAQGVLIGVFDNGFRLLNHQAFDSLRSRIVAMYDFVDKKEDVKPDNPSSGFGAHGVYTFSALAGYQPGQLIGPAFGASFVLARTENDSATDLYPSEEDNWIAAAEWADSLGVQVISSSLGYLEHVKFIDSAWQIDTATSWKWSDMDGKTIPVSRAAAMAARKGIVVVNSAGNDADDRPGDLNTLIAPADADSILTVGAVLSSGAIAWFSSYGPTVDGRIKPDVVARGVGVHAAQASDTSRYVTVNGTSLSCPLVAGAAALILKAHPTATPMEVANALKRTANNAAAPNNQYGWGLINVLAAINSLGAPVPPVRPTKMSVVIRGNNIQFSLPEPAEVTIRVYNILGQEIKTLLNGVQTASASGITWDATGLDGRRVASGAYFFRLEARGASGTHYSHAGKTMILR